MSLMKVYVGCGLTHAPEEFRNFVEDLKKAIAQDGVREVGDFLGLVNGTPADVYQHDLGHVATCDKMVAIVDEPSIGLGMEISNAIALEKPLLCLAHEGAAVTRMIRGAGELGLLSLEYYVDSADATGKAIDFLER